VNEHGSTIREAWDGTNLRFSFRRSVNKRVMCRWYELQEIAGGMSFRRLLVALFNLVNLIQLFGNLTLLRNIRLNLFML
jgi:hypothetical protein